MMNLTVNKNKDMAETYQPPATEDLSLHQPEQQGAALTHDQMLDISTNRVASTLTQIETGSRSDEEISAAIESLGQFGGALQRYAEDRLTELATDGVDGQDVGMVVEELSAKTEILHGTVLGSAGSASEARGTLEKMRVDKKYRMLGKLMLAGAAGLAAWAATKGIDTGVDRLSDIAQGASAWASSKGLSLDPVDKIGLLAPATLLASGTVRKSGGKITKRIFGDIHTEIMDPDDVERIEFIDTYEKTTGRELDDTEKLAISYWLEANNDTEDLKNEMKVFVSERYMSGGDFSTPESRNEVARALTAMTLNHITKLYGLAGAKRLGIAGAVRDAAADSLGEVAGGHEVSKELAKAVLTK